MPEHPTPSPIEQELIDGKMYWGTYGPDLWRLLENEKAGVIGPGQKVRGLCNRMALTNTWVAVFYDRFNENGMPTTRIERGADGEAQGKRWVESMVHDYDRRLALHR